MTDHFLVDASLATIDFEWTSIKPGANVDPNGITPFTPELTWSLGGQYTATGSRGTVFIRMDVIYQDDIFTEASNTAGSHIEDYTLLNGSVVFRTPDDRWSIKLEGKNLTDEEYLFYVQDGSPYGVNFASPALPRTWMLSARRDFF